MKTIVVAALALLASGAAYADQAHLAAYESRMESVYRAAGLLDAVAICKLRSQDWNLAIGTAVVMELMSADASTEGLTATEIAAEKTWSQLVMNVARGSGRDCARLAASQDMVMLDAAESRSAEHYMKP